MQQFVRIPRMIRRPLTALALLACIALISCIGVTPLPKRTQTPQGPEIKTVELGFLHAGQTRRAEIDEKLKLIDTGYRSERYFLGRWSSSGSGGWVILAGYIGAMGNAARFWKVGNLLVEFDKDGAVQRFRTFPDSQLNRELSAVVANSPDLPGDPQELPVSYWRPGYTRPIDAKVVLSRDFKFEELGTLKKRYKFSVPVHDIVKLSTATAGARGLLYTTETLQFAYDLKRVGGPRGKNLNLDVTVPQLVTLMKYFSQASQTSQEERPDHIQ